MVYLINKITQIAMILLIILVVIAAVIFIVYFMGKKKRAKRSIQEEDLVKVAFDRKDVGEYVKHIEDIRGDMLITDGGKRFVAVLKCTGFDFFYETAERQLATVRGMYGFSNTITKPVSYRQYSKPVDLEYTLKRHMGALDERNEELFLIRADIHDLEANLKRDRSSLSAADIALYEHEIEAAKKKEKALQFRCFHLQDEIRAITRYTGSKVDPETVETWVYEWTYDPYDFSYDMNQEEVYYRAIKELYSIGQTKIHALANCGVRAKRCTTEELIDMCRWYSSPVSSERYKLSDIKKSSYFDDVTADDPLERARKRAATEIDEHAQMAFYQAVQHVAQETAAGTSTDNGIQTKGARVSVKTGSVQAVDGTEKRLPDAPKTGSKQPKASVKKTQTATKTSLSSQNAQYPMGSKQASPANVRSSGGRRTIVRARDVRASGQPVGADLIGEE